MDAIAELRHPRLDYRTPEARRFAARWRPFLAQVVFPGCVALDLGCGAGKCTFDLEQLGARAVGIDCSPGMISLAREIAQDIGSSAEFHVGTFQELPFAPHSFDLVWFPQNIIECSYEEVDRIAMQLRTILRPKGAFCLAMRDGMENHGDGGAFDQLTGNRVSAVDAEGRFPYEVTFWTVAFARFVVSRHLDFDRIEPAASGRHVLVFRRPERT